MGNRKLGVVVGRSHYRRCYCQFGVLVGILGYMAGGKRKGDKLMKDFLANLALAIIFVGLVYAAVLCLVAFLHH